MFVHTVGIAHITARAAPELVVVAGRRSEHGALLEGIHPVVLSMLLVAVANAGGSTLFACFASTPPQEQQQQRRSCTDELRVPCAEVLRMLPVLLGCVPHAPPPPGPPWLFRVPCLVWEATRLGEGAWMDPVSGAYNGRKRSTFYFDVEAATPHALAAMPTLLCCLADSLAADAARGRELVAWLRRLRPGDGAGGAPPPMPVTQCAFIDCPCRAGGGHAAAALKRCGRCHAAYYCSVEAQKADWPRHKAECGRRHDDRGAA
jgi:hypothetical protein